MVEELWDLLEQIDTLTTMLDTRDHVEAAIQAVEGGAHRGMCWKSGRPLSDSRDRYTDHKGCAHGHEGVSQQHLQGPKGPS